jgi:hypothetical protein
MADDPKPNPKPIVPHPKKREVPLIKAVGVYNPWGSKQLTYPIYSNLWNEYSFIFWSIMGLKI